MLSGDVSDQFFYAGSGNVDRYTNPFYGIPLQYLPTAIDKQIQWAEHFLFRFGFYRTALQRIANYFISNSLNIECDDEHSKKEYEEIFELLKWKEHLAESGLNLLAYGNDFVSINQGFNRFLVCPQCSKASLIDRLVNFEFDRGKFKYHCPSCSYSGVHKVVDKPSRDVKKIHITHWPVREIKLKYEDTTGATEYYWQIPEPYKNKVTQKNDKFYCKHVPQVIYDAIFENKMVKFNKKNFIHIKVSTPSSLRTSGKAVPPCIYMFDSFFMLKVLERFNEVICFEDINPFRVIAMDAGVQPNNPVLMNQNGGLWAEAVDELIRNHRKDPGSYHKFPFPLNYQQLGGEGKKLAPVELIQMAENNILNALNIPQELYQMNLQIQAVGPALRLFENSWSSLVDSYNQLVQHWANVIGKIRGLTPAKVGLIRSTFADDMERKSVFSQLMATNTIARSEVLRMYNLDYKDQLRKKMEEDLAAQELMEEEQERQEIRRLNKSTIFNQHQGAPPGGDGGAIGAIPQGGTPQDILQQAAEIAQRLHPLDAVQRRTELQKIKAQNETLWSAVKAQLAEIDKQARRQGLEMSKQQNQG